MKNIEYLIEILSKKLAETSKNNEKVQNENKKIEEVLNDLECTYDSIKKYTSDVELRKILEKCSPTDKKYSTDFKILEIFLKGIESGKLSTIDSNVEQIIARIKDSLTQQKESNKNLAENKAKNNILSKIYEKIINSNNEELIFKDSEFDAIEELIKEEEISPEECIKIWSAINEVNLLIANRIEENILAQSDDMPKNIVKIASSLLEEVFKKHGLDYNELSKASRDKIESYGSLRNIENILDYIDSTDDFAFLKLKEEDKKSNEKKLKVFVDILIYSSPELLEYTKNAASENEVSTRIMIVSEPGIFRRGNSEGKHSKPKDSKPPQKSEPYLGTQKNYRENQKALIDKIGPDAAREFIKKSLESVKGLLTCTPTYLFRENIEILDNFGISILPEEGKPYPAQSVLSMYGILDKLSLWIEAGKHVYIKDNRTSLNEALDQTKSDVEKIRYLSIEQPSVSIHNNRGYLRRSYLNDYVNVPEEYFVNLDEIDDFPPEMKECALSSEFSDAIYCQGDCRISELEKMNEESDPVLRKFRYVINGVIISKPKTLSTLGCLIKNNMDGDSALLYSMTKNSAITPEEFGKIKSAIGYTKEK